MKGLGIFCSLVIIISFVLAIIRIMDWKLFWFIAIFMAAIAFWGIPWLKRS